MEILGIDIGGTGVKGAPVNTRTGELLAERYRIPTPQPATPEAVVEVVGEIVESFNWKGAIGCTVPGVVRRGVIYTAANIDNAWIGADAAAHIRSRTNCPVRVLNDADAAGIAEMRFGGGRGHDGVVMIITFGTGIGSALFVEGQLVPNTELGHLKMYGKDAEHRASSRARDEEGLSWKKWGKRVNDYLQYVESLFWPDLFVIGGGVSKKFDKFFPYLDVKAATVPAELRNNAGIVGAALAAETLL